MSTSTDALPDRKVIVCNYAVPTSPVAQGARAYVLRAFGGNLPENVEVAVLSRGGHWIRKWERLAKLENFRWATVPPEHPRYRDAWYHSEADEARTAELEECRRLVVERKAEREARQP